MGMWVPLVMSVEPVFMSVHKLGKVQVLRSDLEQEESSNSFDSSRQQAQTVDPRIINVEDGLGLWLSYWSCWPLLYLVSEILAGQEFFDEKKRPMVDGGLVAMIVWLQWWQMSRVALYVLRGLRWCILALTSGCGGQEEQNPENADEGQVESGGLQE